MNDPIEDFERECADAGVQPEAALIKAGLHRSTWFRWKAGKVSPTFRSLNAAREALGRMSGKAA